MRIHKLLQGNSTFTPSHVHNRPLDYIGLRLRRFIEIGNSLVEGTAKLTFIVDMRTDLVGMVLKIVQIGFSENIVGSKLENPRFAVP